MEAIRLPLRHLRGGVYIRLTDSSTLDMEGYFRCLVTMKPLLDEASFKESTPGFYINYIKDTNSDAPGGGLRINYFSIDNLKTVSAIDNFVKTQSDKINIFKGIGAYQEKTTSLVDISENSLHFWNSLNDSTQIVLDLLKNLGLPSLHNLMYLYGTVCIARGVIPRVFFEPVFVRYSPYFAGLRNESLAEQYWEDLVRNFDEGLPIHFPFNMVLGPYENAFKHLLPQIRQD